MKKIKILGLLLLVAFIVPMGFNELAFALEELNVPELFRKLDRIPPAWSQKLPASQRFQLVLDDQAVLDKETGLVWERSPSTTLMSWSDAIYHCYNMNVDGRKGWRLPTVEELASLVDPTQPAPTLPAGHPFTNVRSSFYWSATTLAGGTSSAWGVSFYGGLANGSAKSDASYVWCVRGGHYDAY